MPIEDTKITAVVGSSRELNKYLKEGWVLILGYVHHTSDTQQPRFVIGWQSENDPIYPEILDEWEIHELDRYKDR